MIGRAWLVGIAHPRRRPGRRAGGRLHGRRRLPRRLHRPPRHGPAAAPAGEEPPPPMSTGKRIAPHRRAASTSVLIVLVDRDLRLGARSTTTSSSRRTSSSSTPGSTSGRSTSTRRVLYLVHRGAPHGRDDAVDLAAGCRRGPNRVQTAVEWLYTAMRDNITRREHGRQDGAQVVPVHRDAVPVHLVLEPDRLHPAADQHASTSSTCSASRSRFALYAATANLSIPLALALIVFIAYNVEGIRAKGFVGYLKSLIPAGVTSGMAVVRSSCSSSSRTSCA